LKKETNISGKIRSSKSKEDSKKFYRELGKKKIDVDEPPQPEEVVDFWSNIWEKEKSHNKDSA